MRVLILHSRYLSKAVSGENATVSDEVALLEQGGHEVQSWEPSPRQLDGIARLGLGMRAVWSTRATSELASLVRSHQPQIIHCHNLFPMLSPAVLRTTPSDAALLMTLHNFRLMCLPATFLRDGSICEDCLGRVPWRGVVHRCYRGSLLGSTALTASLTTHRALGTFDRVDRFLAVSGFVAEKHVQAGFPVHKIHVKPNFAWPSQRSTGPGEHFLVMSRLSPEKDIVTVLRAWQSRFGQLLVVGDGPDAERLNRAAPSGVKFVGSVPKSQVPGILQRSRALLVPSVSYEGWPRSISEAYAAGVPVIASRIGSIPESVEDGVTGLLVPPRDVGSWQAALNTLLEDSERERLGGGALRFWRDHLSPQRGLAALEGAYTAALASR